MLRLVLYIIIAYFSFATLIYLFQRHFIYYPDRTNYRPEQAGVPEMEEVWLTTADLLKIKAWYRKPQQSDLPTIVYFHGNAGNIADRGFIARYYFEHGLGVLLMTYRGYSGNPGNPTEQGLYIDAKAAVQFLYNRGTPSECIVLIGSSIGSAVAIEVATKYPVGAIVLQSPFSSMADIAKIHFSLFKPFTGLIKDKYDSLSKGKKIRAPILIIHGESDKIIPLELGRKLLRTLPPNTKTKYILNKGHNDLFEPDIVLDFIKQKVKCKTPSA